MRAFRTLSRAFRAQFARISTQFACIGAALVQIFGKNRRSRAKSAHFAEIRTPFAHFSFAFASFARAIATQSCSIPRRGCAANAQLLQNACQRDEISSEMKRKDRNTYSKSLSVAVVGVGGVTVAIECQQCLQLPGFSIVGMSANSARETKERVLGAIHASGLGLPSRRIVINLSPACGFKEDGRAFDLPIAIACLAAADVVHQESLAGCAFLGELTLAGELKSARAATVLPRLLRERKLAAACVAHESAAFALGSDAGRGGGFANLADVVPPLRGGTSGYFPTVVAPE